MRNSRELNLAILMWRWGRPISLTLETKLMQQGLDVRALEARYSA